jgi:hypothetical protein
MHPIIIDTIAATKRILLIASSKFSTISSQIDLICGGLNLFGPKLYSVSKLRLV